MKKRPVAILGLMLLLLSLSAIAADCGLFCQAGQWWDGLFSSEEALAGKGVLS